MSRTLFTASTAARVLVVGALLMGLTVGVSAQDAPTASSVCASPGSVASLTSGPSASPWPGPSALTPVSPGTDEGCGSGSGSATVTMEAGEYWFAPSDLSVDSATPTTLRLVGVGQLAHNLTINDLEVQLNVGPGTSAEVTLSDLPPGSYPFYCAIYGHARAGMVGTLIVD